MEGAAFADYRAITQYAPAQAFAYRRWSSHHGSARRPANEITIRYLMEPDGVRTWLRVIQENLPSADYYRLMDSIWDNLLADLKTALESGA